MTTIESQPPDTGSMRRLKASADRWWTRQAVKGLLAYRSRRVVVQLLSVAVFDLIMIYAIPFPAVLIILIGVQLALVGMVYGESELNKTLQGNLSDERLRTRGLENDNADMVRQLAQLRAECDAVARAADAVFLSSRVLPTGRRER